MNTEEDPSLSCIGTTTGRSLNTSGEQGEASAASFSRGTSKQVEVGVFNPFGVVKPAFENKRDMNLWLVEEVIRFLDTAREIVVTISST